MCVTPLPVIPQWCQPAGFAAFTASSKTDCITKVFHLLFVGGNFSNALQQADFLRRDEAAEKDPTRDASPPIGALLVCNALSPSFLPLHPIHSAAAAALARYAELYQFAPKRGGGCIAHQATHIAL